VSHKERSHQTLGCRAAPGWLRYRDGGPTFADCLDIELGRAVANTWHASRVADEVAGGVVVPVPAADAGQLVMGLAMAVAPMVGAACDKYAGLGWRAARRAVQAGRGLRAATSPGSVLQAEVSLGASTAQRTLRQHPPESQTAGGRRRRRGVSAALRAAAPRRRGTGRAPTAVPSRMCRLSADLTCLGSGGAAGLITQRSQVQILPPLQEKPQLIRGLPRNRGGPFRREWQQNGSTGCAALALAGPVRTALNQARVRVVRSDRWRSEHRVRRGTGLPNRSGGRLP